ncbi:MAG: NAD-dependent succinate-semialdehyde dehydrogenase [Desulfobacterales bacterium]|nr:NAD-dependent succinate-semialdehyde dehydrogenase [Desulfobacterales bacterium]
MASRIDRWIKDRCYIDGEWVAAEDGKSMQVFNPADGSVVGAVPSLGEAQIDAAVAAAQRAFAPWREKTAKERAGILRRWHDLIMANQEELAHLMTREQGKPLSESRGEIAYSAAFIEWFAEEGKRLYGDVVPAHQGDTRILVLKQPVGVCAAITPWNFPSAMITRKAGPALAAGCTMVVKPASQTPLSALALAEMADMAGIPAGVFNVVTGDSGRIGRVLSGDSRVRKLTFTGSTAVGKKLIEQCAGTVKKVSMELGGNAPFIVFDDADLAAAVKGAVASKYRNSGQTCVCTNRLLVQEGVYDEFAKRLAEEVASLKVGNGLEEGVEQGPLIDMKAVEKVEGLIADAVSAGARIVSGGRRHTLGGTFFEPTLLADVTGAMRIAQEEIFGPVAPLFRFAEERQAVQMANDTPYGLAAYFYSRDIGRIWRVSEGLDYGIVGVNTGIISTEVAPFGGMKESGIGREGSRYGIDEFVEIKYVCLGGIKSLARFDS